MKKFIISLAVIFLCCIAGTLLYIGSSEKQHLKQYRILACISSFNRPVFISGQILRMLRQSYPVDISVSVKGVPEDFVDEALAKEWAPEIKSGRIKLRIDQNRDQFSNLLDTVRDIDLEQYDYFCKIDDDDWYGPDYFLNVNEWLNKEEYIILSYTTNNLIIRPGTKSVRLTRNRFDLYGPSMCFARDLVKLALMIEKDPSFAGKYMPEYSFEQYRVRMEDGYLARLARKMGKTQNRQTSEWDLAFGWQYPSVMRRR